MNLVASGLTKRNEFIVESSVVEDAGVQTIEKPRGEIKRGEAPAA